jgi:D-alanyl-D-alanine carboxypeptidase/D-alanyl-D-alanine-endopeptidase (penicillin-binding protein 4)
MAELIGLTAADSVNPDVANLDQSADILLTTLEQALPDVSWDKARLDNHSGLSSEARLAPVHLAAVLQRGWDNGMLSSLLPGSGWSGTLARRFSEPDQALRVWAKTGSINYVATLGGYLLSSSHSPAAFVIMISDEEARAAYDAAARRTRASEKKAQAWQEAAEDVLDEIVEGWLQPPEDSATEGQHASRS